jgi:hypothetical protein
MILMKGTKYSRGLVMTMMKKKVYVLTLGTYSRWVSDDNDEEHEIFTMDWR